MSARYSTDDYTFAIQSLFPTGRVWTRATNSVMTGVIRALAAAYQHSDADAIQLLVDAFPATASAMLPEWEATLGLPDDCACNALSDEESRRQAVVSKLIGTGGQSASYFTSLLASMGYGISIKQFRTARAGLAVCGDAINGDRWPYVWEVTVTDAASDAACTLKLLLCRLAEFAPAHTKLMTSYDAKSLFGIDIRLTLADGILSGRLTGSACIAVDDVDITLTYTHAGGQIIQRSFTDSEGSFAATPPLSGTFSVIARAQVWTPPCEWADVESGEVAMNLFFDGAVTYDGRNTYRG
ncbi:YmfQ family protein [Vagococcus sp. WN89Y]|uniref:YmfQ family protein n=1 Tax=Vagococcus sp. WN89Y TaxID=3457258 RepID=UPI003FCE25DD